jgi:Parvulin-like peptidyl-prolyl isomerase
LTGIKKKFAVLMASVMAFGILASGCSLIEKTPEAIAKEKVAKVGGEYITRGELNDMMVPVKAQIASQNGGDNYLTSDQGKQDVLDQEKQTLQSLIEARIFEQKAKELKLFKDEAEIESGITAKKDELIKAYETEDALNKYLEQSKISADMLKKLLRVQVVGQKVYDNMIKDIAVTDDEIQKYYDQNKTTLTEQPNTMEVSHILVATEQEAKDIKAKLDKGEDFAALAKQYSTDTGSKDAGGSLGEIQYNDSNYDQTFMVAAMALKAGEVSQPVKTTYGYHIIKVTKKNEYPILTFDKAKDSIKEQLLYNKQEETYTNTLNTWKEAAKIKYYDSKLKS